MKQNQILVLACMMLLSIVIVISCSKSKTSSSGTPSSNTVNIANMAFAPLSLTVKVGTTVTWKNNDGITHTVTSNDGTSFNSGNLSAGSSFSYTTTTTGTFDYHCTIHAGMVGTLIVTQ